MAQIAAGWRVASIYDPATGTTVQLNSLLPESRVEIKPMFVERAVSTTFAGFAAEAVFEFYDDAGMAQLRTWLTNFTPVRAVAVGSSVNLQWYESVTLASVEMDRVPDARTGLHRFRVKLNYAGDGSPNIYLNRNLLAFAGWQDTSPVDNLADNWSLVGATAISFTSAIQTINTTSTGHFIRRNFEFPISGINLTISCDFTTTADGIRLGMLVKNFAGAALVDSSMNQTTTTGIASHVVATVAGVYSIDAIPIRQGGSATSGNRAARNPALTTDGSRTPGTSFMNN